MKKPKAKLPSRSEFCEAVAKSLREFGYLDVNRSIVETILAAWLKSRTAKMPHGVIGMFARRQFDEMEENNPGVLAKLEK